MKEEIAIINNIVAEGALRWLQSVDLRKVSIFYGQCDREFWAWKTKDFPNGTWQAGLSGFLDARELLGFSDAEVGVIADAVIWGTKKIQRSNGSFEEAYPLESSMAVTSLVVFNLQYCISEYGSLLSSEAVETANEVIRLGIEFLRKTPESHGQIANHCCTRDMTYYLEGNNRELDFLKLKNQEGWFVEYGGADPGYQTLLNHYLVVANRVKLFPSDLHDVLRESQLFCEKFFFNDGSFSGAIGSRGTAILYPSGLLKGGVVDAWQLSWMKKAHAEKKLLTPNCVDSGNFVPLFNSWSFFAKYLEGVEEISDCPRHTYVNLDSCGIKIREGVNYKVIISTKNGVVKMVTGKGNSQVDESLYGFVKDKLVTQGTPIETIEREKEEITISFFARKFVQRENGALQAVILRIIALLIYKFPSVQRLIKRVLAKYVMGHGGRSPTSICVTLKFGESNVNVDIAGDNGWHPLSEGFYTHMASANSFSKNLLR